MKVCISETTPVWGSVHLHHREERVGELDGAGTGIPGTLEKLFHNTKYSGGEERRSLCVSLAGHCAPWLGQRSPCTLPGPLSCGAVCTLVRLGEPVHAAWLSGPERDGENKTEG